MRRKAMDCIPHHVSMLSLYPDKINRPFFTDWLVSLILTCRLSFRVRSLANAKCDLPHHLTNFSTLRIKIDPIESSSLLGYHHPHHKTKGGKK